MEKQKESNIKIKQSCSKCGSGQVYLRISSFEKVCRQCGYIEKVSVKELRKND